ncbi:MAG: hypothetical protein LBL90_07585 [Prevotellaceae bacterium]|jgi:hypothetical protein|nr:hypothetical protein [Prevotellaceae bacterium]
MSLDINLIYKEKIEGLAKNKTDEVFYNSSEEHAQVVVNAIAKNAEHEIKILCCNMCSKISNNEDYLKSVKGFLSGNKDRKIQILFTKYSDEFPQKPIAGVFKEYADQVEIKKWDSAEKITLKGEPVNFTVSDDRAYRMETDIEKRLAFGNFNNPEGAKNLSSVFDELFNSTFTHQINI